MSRQYRAVIRGKKGTRARRVGKSGCEKARAGGFWAEARWAASAGLHSI